MSPTNFITDALEIALQNIDKAIKQAYQMIWDTFILVVIDHWIVISLTLTFFLVWAVVRAFSGRYGMLGSILYNYLYFGILFAVGLIKGPLVFVNDYFEIICLLILYPICYLVVGLILDKLGLRRRY